LLGGFADRHIAALDEAALDRLEALLALPEPQLQAWLIGGVAPPPEWDDALMQRLREDIASGAGVCR
jgi:succinate dehydrogenase flavin-adding protein (antitoxin of CptAB toxin-antitoxin module)